MNNGDTGRMFLTLIRYSLSVIEVVVSVVIDPNHLRQGKGCEHGGTNKTKKTYLDQNRSCHSEQ